MAIEEQRQLGQASTKTGEANANVDSINSERTIQETNRPNEKSKKSSTVSSSSPQEEPPCVEKDTVLQGTQSVAAKTKGSSQKGQAFGDQKAKTTSRSQNLKGKRTVPRPFSLATDKRMSREKKISDRPATSSKEEYANPLGAIQTHTSLRPERATELRRSGSTVQSVVRTQASVKVETSDGRSKSAPKDKGRSERQPEATNMSKLVKSAPFKAMPLPRFYSKKSASPNGDALEKVKEEEEKEVKKLQRSSTFRASPLPSFYHKKSPPRKPEFIKIPLTRAKSPNLGPKSKSLANGMNKATARPMGGSAKETTQSSTTSCGEELEKAAVSSAGKVGVIVSS